MNGTTFMRVARYGGAMILAVLAPSALALSTTWTGSGHWTDGGHWSDGVPSDGSQVVVASGTCVLDAVSADLGSLEVQSGAVLVFSNWTSRLLATGIVMRTGGGMTIANPFNSYTNVIWPDWLPSNRLAITCMDLNVESGAVVNANGKGYLGGWYSDPTYYPAHGPGAGARMQGGGHASPGGRGNTNAPYGVPTHPLSPGSGGGPEYMSNGGVIGHGGGAIEILASGRVRIDGAVSADGLWGRYGCWGGGAGGSVYIECQCLEGTGGRISADGGNSVQYAAGGSGSGGRIAVIYSTAVQATSPVPDVVFSARSKLTVDRVYYSSCNSDLGTLYFPDDRLLVFPPRHSGIWMAATPTVYTVALDEMDVSGSNLWMRLNREGFSLSVSNAMTVQQGARLEFTNATAVCGSLTLRDFGVCLWQGTVSTGPTLTVHGDLTLTNDAFLKIVSGPTNGTAPYGNSVDVGGALRTADASWIFPESHSTNGGSVRFRVGSLNVATGAGFNASSLGYRMAFPTKYTGFGPGGGGIANSTPGGGGYGGRGGSGRLVTQAFDVGGLTYGDSNAPVQCGSAGGKGGDGANAIGGRGGGLIWIEASSVVTVDGMLKADGEARGTGVNEYGAGGSGGGIYVKCKRFGGSGLMSANGGRGAGNVAIAGGGGGGGRIAVARVDDRNNYVVTSVTNGIAAEVWRYGELGTVAWEWLPTPGTVISLR